MDQRIDLTEDSIFEGRIPRVYDDGVRNFVEYFEGCLCNEYLISEELEGRVDTHQFAKYFANMCDEDDKNPSIKDFDMSMIAVDEYAEDFESYVDNSYKTKYQTIKFDLNRPTSNINIAVSPSTSYISGNTISDGWYLLPRNTNSDSWYRTNSYDIINTTNSTSYYTMVLKTEEVKPKYDKCLTDKIDFEKRKVPIREIDGFFDLHSEEESILCDPIYRHMDLDISEESRIMIDRILENEIINNSIRISTTSSYTFDEIDSAFMRTTWLNDLDFE